MLSLYPKQDLMLTAPRNLLSPPTLGEVVTKTPGTMMSSMRKFSKNDFLVVFIMQYKNQCIMYTLH